MPKSFAKKVVLLIAVNLLIKPLWVFWIERTVQIEAGFESYGLYFSILNFTYLLSVINDMGLSSYNTKLVAQASNQLDKHSFNFGIKILLNATYIITVIVLGYLLGYWQQAFLLMLTLMIYQICYSFLGYLRSYLTAIQYFKADILISILDKILLIIFFIPLLGIHFNGGQFSIQTFASAQLIAILISVLVCLIILKGKVNFSFKRVDLNKFWSFFKQLLPFSLFMFLVLAYNKIDSIMLVSMLENGALESGIYAAAYRLLDAATMIPILFASFFYPVISKLIAEKKDIKDLVLVCAEILISFAIVLAASLWYFNDDLMQLIYQSKSSAYLSEVFGILVWSIIPITIYYIFSSALTAKGNLKALNFIALLSLLLNVGLNIFLIPQFKALGASIATLISLSAAALAYLYFYSQIFKNRINILLIIKFFLLFVFIGIAAFAIHYLFIHWMLKFLLFVVIGVSLTFILKLISLKKIFSLTKFTS